MIIELAGYLLLLLHLDFSNNTISCFESMREKQVADDDLRIEDSRTSSNDEQSSLLKDKAEHRGVINETQQPSRRFVRIMRFNLK